MTLEVLSKRDTAAWQIAYRYTPTDRRRVLFTDPDTGETWEVVDRARATHVRKHAWGLSPTYLRRAS